MIGQLKNKSLADLKLVNSLDSLEEWRVNYLGRKGEVANLFILMGEMDSDQRPEAGKVLNKFKSEKTNFYSLYNTSELS